jgi:hypothetical protein
MRIKIITKFDCTATGITGHFRPGKLPIRDRQGQLINNEQQWVKARNQQRNFESILQLISLFTQPLNITQPSYHSQQQSWVFEFDIEYQSVFDYENDRLGLLKKHCHGIPMILGLNETDTKDNVMIPGQNVQFELIDDLK